MLRLFAHRLLVCWFLLLVLFADILAPWPVSHPSVAFAQALKDANPPLSAPAWLTPTKHPTHPNLNKSVRPTKAPPTTVGDPTRHRWPVSMKPARLVLSTAAQHFLSSDGQLEVDIQAGSLDATQLASSSGGLLLYITQVKPGGGSTNGGLISFGTYEFQFFDGTGKPVSGVRLLHPFTVQIHLPKGQQLVWSGQKVYALWTAVKGMSTPPDIPAATSGQSELTGVVPMALSNQPSTLIYAQGSNHSLNWSIQTSFAASAKTNQTTPTPVVSSPAQGVPAVQAGTIGFNTQAPQATWGKPTDFQVGLNSGGLNYRYPLNIPPGPGGFQPSLSLNYSSGSVNENHNWQSAAPWVGQGWNLDLGSITWAQENVTPNGSPTLENVWHINDASGISGQLIPPDVTYSTDGTLNPSIGDLGNNANVYIWHSAPESHAKIREIAFGNYPCWRVYLPSGVTEEYGCTNDSRESYKDDNGNWDAYSWNLDMMTDSHGNQVHISYQTDVLSGVAVRDAVISDITYGVVDIHFDASHSVDRLLNGGCGSGDSSTRCDDPADLSGSHGFPAPKVMSAYVLNDVKMEVQGHLLHEYLFSYNQGGPTTETDPNTGQSESAAGYLTLGKIQEAGTDGTSLNAPEVNIQYAQEWEHYSDLFSYSYYNGSNYICSPYQNAPRDGGPSGPCYLWSQSFNQYYITNLDNGEGWNESISWQEAHSNTWGTDNGNNYNNAFTCSSSQSSTNVCGRADDKNWSRQVVASRSATSNGVKSTWSYTYYLTDVSASIPGYETRSCTGRCESYDWGNQNDDDSADYYNGDFQSFSQTQVILPDGSSQTDTYGSTNGWGIFSNSITCQNGNNSCSYAPYNASNGPVLAGKQLREQDYNSSSQRMKQIDWSWSTNCPPQGVPGSKGALGGATDPGNHYLFSWLDHNNPVMVCDPRSTQEISSLFDGGSSSVAMTTNYSYDGNNCGSTGYDYGNLTRQDETASDVNSGNTHIVSQTQFCPNDNISGSSGIYLTDLPIQTQMQDGSGTQYGCTQTIYGSNTGYNQQPTVTDITRTDSYTAYTGACTGSVVTTLHSYDATGNPITATDPDGHQGCPNGNPLYSACASYDSYEAHMLTATNAKNQVTTYEYDQDAPEAGYGEWLMSETDPNGQTTSYTYDALGRLTSVIRPGDSLDNPTITYTYINRCHNQQTAPCLEIDTATRFTSGGPMSTEKQWYDGWGNLVETQTPGPNPFSRVPYIPSVLITYTVYDNMGRETIKSLNYAVADPPGLGYVVPDLNQPRTQTSYDSLGRTTSTITYGYGSNIVQQASTTYSIAPGVPTISGENNTYYEQATTLDGYQHQSITYTDGFGQTRYSQVYSGTDSPYSVIRTVGTIYDTVGNTLSVTTYDNTGTAKATYSATYDGLKRLTGYNDSDLGSCGNSPQPPSCGNSSTAWSYTYDADGNQLSQTDPRNQSRYSSYDNLDRPLCSALTAADANACSGSTDQVYFYDDYSNASTPGATFPSGCSAPSGNYASDPIGRKTAEIFIGTSGAGRGWRCYGYDERGETDQSTLSVTTPRASTLTQTVNMTYNDGGEITGLVYPGGETLTSTYDVNGRLQSIYFGTPSSPDPVPFLVGNVSYTNNGQVASMALGGSGNKNRIPLALFTTATQYDSIQRPLSNTVTEAGQTIWSQTRAYDNVGNVLGLSTVVPTQGGGSATENESFCYDALSRLAWAGNAGTPSGGDHCMAPPTGSTLPAYSQAYSYDSLDRLTSSAAGTYSYGDPSHIHAATNVSSIPNQYAAYDAMGNMTCRNTDPSSGHTCSGNSPTGATMSYDSRGQLASWTAPSGTVGNATYLYDNQGNRVLAHASNATDTIYFDGYTETVMSGLTVSTTKYYSANGARVAVRVGSATLDYLVSDPLGSNSMALNSSGQVIALQHYRPYGTVDYSWGTMPTSYNYTGQRLDSQTGLLYYGFRYYDPVTGRFVRSDNVQDNSSGMDPYAYVGDNPETRNDPSGHCWPWCTALIGAAIGAVVGVAVTTVQSVATTGKLPSAGQVLQSAVAGAVSGAIIGVTGPGAGLVAAIGIGAVSGAAGGVAGKLAYNAVTRNSAGDGLLEAGVQGAVIGGLTGGLLKGSGLFFNRFAGRALTGATAAVVDTIRSLSTKVGDFTGLSGSDFSDIVDRIPSSARSVFWKDSGNISDGGYKWRWSSDPVWRLEIHGPDSDAPLGSNASSGWVFRVQQGHYYMDDAGDWWKDNIWRPNSPFYNPDAWNDTHIPMHGPQP